MPTAKKVTRPHPLRCHLFTSDGVEQGLAKIAPATDLTDARPIDRERGDHLVRELAYLSSIFR
jgi:hypothetical protein